MDSRTVRFGEMSDQVVYSLAQAAQILGVHYETVARWVRTGKLQGVRLSRRKVVVPKEKLDRFLAQERRAASPAGSVLAGSPERWLALAGSLTSQEAEALRDSAEVYERAEEAI
jgi:excisionase family DNA binding protein